MKKILHIVSSPRGNESNSTHLGNRIVEKLQAEYPNSSVTVNNTVTKNYSHFTEAFPIAFKTPAEQFSAEQKELMSNSDAAVQELIDADFVVISLPIYNFNMPSALKAWLDHIIRAGLTFSYATGKPEGLLKGKKAYLALSSNGVYSEGPIQSWDHAEPYLRFILGFIGITDITTHRIEGLGIKGYMENAVEKGLERVAV